MPHISRTSRLIALLSLFPLAACVNNTMSRPIGLSREAPDELMVSNNAPLSQPPDFDLRATGRSGGAALVGAVDTPAGPAAAAGLDAGQQALVEAAGPAAPSNIRREVDQDAQLDQVNRGFSDRLMYWTPPAGTSSYPIIQVRNRSSGFLGGLF